MSNDLISRSKLLEELSSFTMRITGKTDTVAMVIMEETKKSIVNMISEQPAACDMDHVVEELMSKSAEYDKNADNHVRELKSYFRGVAAGYRFAAEEVKAGGIRE